MTKIIAPCGIICSDCSAYKATQTDDWEKLAEIAVQWSEDDTKYEAEEMVCDGCLGKRLNIYCATCSIRDCALDKDYTICSQCPEYVCEKLESLWSSFSGWSAETLKANLAEVKRHLLGN
jgi:hypothetical protein